MQFFNSRDRMCYFTTPEITRMETLSTYENRRSDNMHDNLEHRLREGPHLSSDELKQLKRMRAERHMRGKIAQAALTGELPLSGYHAAHLDE